MAKIADISSEIFLSLGEPSDVSIASIAQKLRFTIGELGNLLNNDFIISTSTYEILDEDGNDISENQSAILKKLYEIYYWKKNSQSFLGAAGVNSVVSLQQDGIVTRFVERNGISKSYLQMYKDARDELKQLLNNYKYNRAIPSHVRGDDVYSKFDVTDPE